MSTVRVDVLVTIDIERNNLFDDPGDQAEAAVRNALVGWGVEVIAVEAGDWSEMSNSLATPESEA